MEDTMNKLAQDVSSFLILPVQRLPRYKILLKELLKNTPSEHLDYPNLITAKDTVIECNQYVNDKKRDQDIHEELRQIELRQAILDKKPKRKGSKPTAAPSPSPRDEWAGRKGSVSLVSNATLLDMDNDWDEQKFAGKMKISVKEARDLPAMDRLPGASSDPYCKIELEEQQFKTKVRKKTLAPKWGQEFVFTVHNLETSMIKLECWDWNRVTEHQIIGRVEIMVKDVMNGTTDSPTWYPLVPASSKSESSSVDAALFAGQVLLGFKYYDRESTPMPKKRSASVVFRNPSSPTTTSGESSPTTNIRPVSP